MSMNSLNVPIIVTGKEVKLERADELIGEWNSKRDILNGGCIGCLSIVNLKKLTNTYFHEGKAEIYSEMLMFCFSIKFEEIDKDNDVNFICEVCIRRLRDAADFKRQLEDAQSALKNLLDAKPIGNFTLPDENGSLGTDDVMCEEIDSQEALDIKPIIENLPVDTVKILTRKKIRQMDGELSQNHINGQNRAAVLSAKYVNNSTSKIRKEYIIRRKLKRGEETLPFELNTTDLQCKLCNESFVMHRSLKMHMSTHYPNHVCEICGYLSLTQKKAVTHSATHRLSLLTCPLCPERRYKDAGALRSHTKTRHLGMIDRYKCPLCNERFKDFNRRRQHLVEMHDDKDRKHGCKLCAKTFKLGGTLSKHVRSVHLKERNYPCPECERGFFTKRGLADHMLSHSGERRFICQHCQKGFKRKTALTQHVKIHTGEKKHVCNVCGRAFTQGCTLRGHMTVHEREAKFKSQV